MAAWHRQLAFGAVLVLAIAACSSTTGGGSDESPSPSNSPENGANSSGTVEVTAPDGGGTTDARMRVGETLELTLESNPTTGFVWEVSEIDNTLLTQEKEPDYVPDHDPNDADAPIGSGGKDTFSFRAEAPGETQLELIYRQPFDKEASPAETVVVDVTVEA